VGKYETVSARSDAVVLVAASHEAAAGADAQAPDLVAVAVQVAAEEG
jgi:hypothetical protein